MVRLTQGIDDRGNVVVGAIPQSDTIYNVELAAGIPKYIVPPNWANFVLISAANNSDVYTRFGLTAGLAVPSGDILDGTSPEITPLLRQLNGTSSIGLVTSVSGGCNVTLAFYK